MFVTCCKKFLVKQLSLTYNPVLESYYNLIDRFSSDNHKLHIVYKTVPSLIPFKKILYLSRGIFSSILPASYIPIRESIFWNPHIEYFRPLHLDTLPNSIVQTLFSDYVHSNFPEVTAFYTDGSKFSVEGRAGAGVYSPELGLKLMYKLPFYTTIFSAEAWAIYQALLIIIQLNIESAVIFTDSLSVLDDIASPKLNSKKNYICIRIKDKLYEISKLSRLTLVWIPSHKGIRGNDIVDALAKKAVLHGQSSPFYLPYTDLFPSLKGDLNLRFSQYLDRSASFKGTQHHQLYRTESPKPWFRLGSE